MRKVRRIRASFIISVIALLCIIGGIYYIFSTKPPDPIEEDMNLVKPILILQYTPVFGSWHKYEFEDCPWKDRCSLVFDKIAVKDADAVVLHAADLASVVEYPLRKFQGQKHVLYSMESPYSDVSLGRLKKVPANFFDWVMTPLSSSHVHSPYGGYWVNPRVAKENAFPPVKLPSDAAAIMANKSIPGAFWLVSNCVTPSKREVAVDALSKYFPVDIAGACAKDAKLRTICPKGNQCHDQINKYYFIIIIENTVCSDYITEKYWWNYELPVIPIVMRKKVYEMKVPPKSYIAMDEFKSPKEMGEYLTMLTKNQTAYMEYFKWRKDGWAKAPWNAKGYEIGYCGLCSKLLNDHRRVDTPIANISKWYLEKGDCETDEFAKKLEMIRSL